MGFYQIYWGNVSYIAQLDNKGRIKIDRKAFHIAPIPSGSICCIYKPIIENHYIGRIVTDIENFERSLLRLPLDRLEEICPFLDYVSIDNSGRFKIEGILEKYESQVPEKVILSGNGTHFKLETKITGIL